MYSMKKLRALKTFVIALIAGLGMVTTTSQLSYASQDQEQTQEQQQQEPEQQEATPPQSLTVPPPTLEEIVVLGNKNLSTIRFEIRNLQKDIYGQLNDLIEDEEFQMDCRMRKRSGSYIRFFTCEPAFLTEYRREAMSQALLEAGDPTDYAFYDILASLIDADRIRLEVQEKFDEYKAMINELVVEHPEIADSIIELQHLTDEEQRRKNSWWSDRFGRD